MHSANLREILSPACDPETEFGRERSDEVDCKTADRAVIQPFVVGREGDCAGHQRESVLGGTGLRGRDGEGSRKQRDRADV